MGVSLRIQLSEEQEDRLLEECRLATVNNYTEETFTEWLDRTYKAKPIWSSYNDYLWGLWFTEEKDEVLFKLKCL